MTLQQCTALLELYEQALREITKKEGPFSRDPAEHAGNVIESMAELADRALADGALAGEEADR